MPADAGTAGQLLLTDGGGSLAFSGGITIENNKLTVTNTAGSTDPLRVNVAGNGGILISRTGAGVSNPGSIALQVLTNGAGRFIAGYTFAVTVGNDAYSTFWHQTGRMWVNNRSGQPPAWLTITGTTEQMRLEYDETHYFSAVVSAAGAVTFNAVGSAAGFGFSQPVKAAGYKSADGSDGATGSFVSADGKTVTVKNGIITGIV